MEVIIIEPKKEPYVKDIPNVEAMEDIIGRKLEITKSPRDHIAFIEGEEPSNYKEALPKNYRWKLGRKVWVYGTVIMCGIDGEELRGLRFGEAHRLIEYIEQNFERA